MCVCVLVGVSLSHSSCVLGSNTFRKLKTGETILYIHYSLKWQVKSLIEGFGNQMTFLLYPS